MTDEFEEWLRESGDILQEKVAAALEILAEEANGPQLGRPLVDTVYDSNYSNMKELRPTSTSRVFFAFDPTQSAILLVAGDKAGKPEKRWYKQMIRKADRLYKEHLTSIERKS